MTLSKASLGEALDYIADAKFTNDQKLMDICAAARFVERLLPVELVDYDGVDDLHTVQLWDEGLVAVVLKVLGSIWSLDPSHYPTEKHARAVLAALTQEVEK